MVHMPQHDSLFREVFSLPLVARQFLTRWLPREFVELVDWSTLRVEKISGVNTALVERQEDFV
jgi:predicted transposase YdaD